MDTFQIRGAARPQLRAESAAIAFRTGWSEDNVLALLDAGFMPATIASDWAMALGMKQDEIIDCAVRMIDQGAAGRGQ
jgi:hypothetical protein